MSVCGIHGATTELRLDDWFCDSEVDLGSRTLVMRVRVKIREENPMRVISPDCLLRTGPRMRPRVTSTYRGDALAPGEMTTIEQRFQADIDAHWNGKLQLVPLNGASLPLTCSIALEFVHDNQTVPHLTVRLIKNPRLTGTYRSHGPDRRYPDAARQLPFRANCWANSDPSGVDMTLDWYGTGWDVSGTAPDHTGTQVPVAQNYLAHEFGHYLGLDHSCHVASSTAVGWCSTDTSGQPDEYCRGTTQEDMNRIMAMGNVVVADNGTPWQQRLAGVHHYRCEEGYAPRLTSAPP